MFRSWGAIGSPIFAEIEGGRDQNGTFLGDFTWNDPALFLVVAQPKDAEKRQMFRSGRGSLPSATPPPEKKSHM